VFYCSGHLTLITAMDVVNPRATVYSNGSSTTLLIANTIEETYYHEPSTLLEK